MSKEKKRFKVESSAIKKTKILPYPKNCPPVACLYRFTNRDTNEKYTGVHKYKKGERPGDGNYWHSSKNKKFKKICGNPKSNLLYEILEYGEYDVMTVREWEELSKVDAVNNPMYYNDSNGSPAFKPNQLQKVEDTFQYIWKWASKTWGEYCENEDLQNECPFDIDLEDSDKIYESGGKQVKAIMDDGLVRYIQKEIDKPKSDGGTWINLCKCVLFIGDKVFNGHHTKKGVWLSTSNTTPTMRVSESLLDGWTESEKRLLANKFNPKPQVRENDMSVDDGIKLLKDNYETDGIPAQLPSNVDMLKGLGFESTEVTRIITTASKDIERNNLSLNSTWIDWTASGWSTELSRLKQALKNAFLNSIVVHSSTESLSLGPLEKVHDAYYDTNEDNFLEETDKDIDTLIVLPHIPLPSVASKYNSDTGEREKFRSRLEMFCEPLSIEVKIVTLPTDTPDSNTNGDGGFWGTRQATMWAKKNGLDGVRKKLYLEWKKEQDKKNKEAA
tara:strand:- start:3575 stop:5077 length:1503 start_codon:yes stop_codon:yes gene_type:complete